jgi:putative exosortase-associated protein (TIGR04073 family)
MKTTMKVLVGVVAISMMISLVMAEEQTVNKAPEREVDHMGVKMVRGITNVATGAGEFPRQIYRSGKEDGLLVALPYGLARGLAMTFLRVGYGVLETVFFFIPFDGGYESALNPAYVWEEEAHQ